MDGVELGCVPEKKELQRVLYTCQMESTCARDHFEIADAIKLGK